MKLDPTIIAAAEQLLAGETGADFTIDQLATATGLSRATVYRRVGSKEALLAHIAETRGIAPAELGARDIRATVLQTARTLFSRHGLVSVTMEQIAQEAGVGVATLYRHFGDKAGLLLAFSDEFRPKQLLTEMAFTESGDLAADLQPIVRVLLHFLAENSDILRLTMTERTQDIDLLQNMRNTPERTLHRLIRIFQQPIVAERLAPLDPQAMALSLLGMIFGFSFIGPTVYNLTLDNPDAVAQTIVRIFLDGVRGPVP